MVEVFVKVPGWEDYIDHAKGWDCAVFEPETLQLLAQEADDLLSE
jgi:hypothetical protein